MVNPQMGEGRRREGGKEGEKEGSKLSIGDMKKKTKIAKKRKEKKRGAGEKTRST